MGYNRLNKQAEVGVETRLRGQTWADKLEIDGDKTTDKMLDEIRGNTEVIDTTEVQLDDDRPAIDDVLTQNKISEHHNTDAEGLHVKPMDLLAAAHEQARLKEYKKSEVKRDTEFWDNYLAVPDSIGEAPSQLQNHPDRFGKLSVNPRKLLEKVKVREMVTASLRDADAILLGIYVQATAENRDLTSQEFEVVTNVNAAKVDVIAQGMNQMGAMPHQGTMPDDEHDHLADRIEHLQLLLRENGPDHQEHDRIQEELHQLVQKARENVQHEDGGMAIHDPHSIVPQGTPPAPVGSPMQHTAPVFPR